MRTLIVKRVLVAGLLSLLWSLVQAQAYYDPTIQRWINRDPIGETGGINLDQFSQNNPISHIDPLGLACSGKIVAGHGITYLQPTLESIQGSAIKGGPYVFVGCGANSYNQQANEGGFGISDYPVNNDPPLGASWPSTVNNMPNPNAPHGPMWPIYADNDYLASNDVPDMVDAAIAALKKALCANPKCKKVSIRIACQPLRKEEIAQGFKPHKSCGKTLKLQCSN